MKHLRLNTLRREYAASLNVKACGIHINHYTFSFQITVTHGLPGLTLKTLHFVTVS